MKRAIATAPGKKTKHVNLTQEEIDQRTAEDAKHEKERPMREWLEEIAAEDNGMPRYFEDLLDALVKKNVITKNDLSLELKKKYNKKKQIRSRKPT